MMMYVLMFFAAIRLRSKFADLPRPFTIPGGPIGYYSMCFLGLLGCFITLVIGFFPPETNMDIGGANHYRFIFACGNMLMLIPAILLYFYSKRPGSIRSEILA